MELLEFKNNVLKLFNIQNVDQLPTAIISSKFSSEMFDKYLSVVEDLKIDWLQHLFQYYQADRKEKMQDYTPESLSKAVARLSITENTKVCLDLCAGSGSLTIKAWEYKKDLSFVCKEYDERVIPILLFNLAIRNISAEVIHTDVLSGEVFKCYRVEKGEKYGAVFEIKSQTFNADVCISNPPYNMKWERPAFAQLQGRFSNYTLPPESNANFAFILTALDEAKEKASLILPSSVLSSTLCDEADIRKELVEMNYIESVVVCPDNMFSSTTIGTCILTLNKKKNAASVEFVDLRNKYIEVEREQNGQFGGNSHTNRTYKKTFKVISDEQITEVIKVITEMSSVGGYCKSASIEDIKSNDHILIVSRYVEFQTLESKHREYSDIVADLNRIIKQKNACKLTINETLARALGFDVDLFRSEENKELDTVIEKISGTKIVKSNYFSTTKNKNEIKFENADKDIVSSVFLMIFQTWKQHIFFLNTEENRYLAEMRDALLPDLMTGTIDV